MANDMTLKDHIKGPVKFKYARKGNLWYQCATGFMFPVPFDDMGDGDFLPEDKGTLFMRWIRKQLEAEKSA